MRIISFRYPRNKVTDILISLMCLFIIILILQNGKTYVRTGQNISESTVVSFISQNGWLADTQSVDIKEKLIPAEFDDTYLDYNQLQKQQGFNLEDYRGTVVLQYSFPLLNYPGFEYEEGIFINILTYNDIIIAADICSTSINGFITGVIDNG